MRRSVDVDCEDESFIYKIISLVLVQSSSYQGNFTLQPLKI
jgi:hypothetical protein